MLERWGPHAANLLTATRVLFTPLFMLTVWFADRSLLLGMTAVLIFSVVAASDVLDGRVARRWHSDSSAGQVFDHFADIGFLVLALTTYVCLGLAPWWVPAAVAGSFAFYVIDSQRVSACTKMTGPSGEGNAAPPPRPSLPILIGSRIGHVGGVCNYVLVGVLVCNNSARIQWLSPAFLRLLFYLVPLYSGAAVMARILSASPRDKVPSNPRTLGPSNPIF